VVEDFSVVELAVVALVFLLRYSMVELAVVALVFLLRYSVVELVVVVVVLRLLAVSVARLCSS